MAKGINWLGRALGLVCAAALASAWAYVLWVPSAGLTLANFNVVTALLFVVLAVFAGIAAVHGHARGHRVGVPGVVLPDRRLPAGAGSLAPVGGMARPGVARLGGADLAEQAARRGARLAPRLRASAAALEWPPVGGRMNGGGAMRELRRAMVLVAMTTWLAACAPEVGSAAMVRSDAREAARRLDRQRGARVRAQLRALEIWRCDQAQRFVQLSRPSS